MQVIYDDNLPDVNDGLYGKFKHMNKSFLAMRSRNQILAIRGTRQYGKYRANYYLSS